jgi:hypothetical protein
MANQLKTTYKKDGLVYTLPGIEYQVKLSVLLFKRALINKCQFRIAAEREGAGKFDDLEIQIFNSNVHRLYQLKHVEDSTKHKITTGDLENMKDGRFSLPKYFSSYRQIKEASCGMSFEFLIFTNLGLEKKLRENFENTGKDELLDLKNLTEKKNLELLKFKKACSFRESLNILLKTTSDLEQIKAKLIHCMTNEKDIDFKDKILKKYQATLLKYVFDQKNQKFRQKFLNKHSEFTGGLKELQLCLLSEIAKSGYKNKLNIKPCIDIRIPESMTNANLVDLPNDKIDDEEINDFLDKLVLAVNQPDETELNAIIEKCMSEDKDINLLDNRFVASEILSKMIEWTKQKEGTYLTQEEGQEMFKLVREMLSKLILIGPTRDYCTKLESFGLSFQLNPAGLLQFLNSDNQILHLVNSYKAVFSSIKLHEILKALKNYDKDDSYMFAPLGNVQRLGKKVAEAFKSSDLLVIEFSVSNDRMEDAFSSVLHGILNENSHKKIIFITTQSHSLPKVFSKNVVSVKDRHNSFKDLSEISQATLLNNKVVSFQGHLSSIDKDLTDCLDADILFKMINNFELEIGGKLPDLSDIMNFYVPRKFQKIQIMDSILSATEFYVINDVAEVSSVESDQDIILISEESDNFEILCNQFKDHTIHWVQKIVHGSVDSYVWRKTHGSNLSKLRKYFTSTGKYDVEEMDFSEMKVVIIAAQPGMGKSTELTRLAGEFKATDPSYWVFRTNLVDCSTILREQESYGQTETLQFLHKLLSTSAEANIRLLEKKMV